MMKSPKWPDTKYFGKTKAEIKKLWADNGKAASKAGTNMHYDIECFYNDQEVEIDEDCVEFDYFMAFENDIGSKLEPYRTEWMVWDKELKLAGSIDMVFRNPDGTLLIYDWKRCKNIKKDNRFQSSITPCIDHLPDTNYWHYCLQLNTYKAIIEEKYGKKVGAMYLVCMHPENKRKNFERIKVVDLSDDIKSLFADRMKRL